MLTDKERTQLRYLLKKAGCKHLIGQIPELTLRRHGAPKKGHDDFLLAGFELAVCLLKRDHGVSSRARALRMLARAAYLGEETAKTPEQFAARLGKKLSERGFAERDIRTLVPPGIDAEWLELTFDAAGDFLVRTKRR
jgi:hypothetical protein